MRYLKDLVIETKRALKAMPGAETPALEKALDAADEFLKETKSFEYIGEISMPHSTIKLTELNQDLDDIIRLMAGKRSDIKLSGEIYIISHSKPVAEEETKAA